jgi:membrane protease YdiL (CAAX protease family)
MGTAWLIILVAWAGWLLRPASSAVLPPQRRRAVPWGGLEVLLAFLVSQFLWPSVLSELLRVTQFFRWVYGPGFQAEAQRAQGGVNPVNYWLGDLALPLNLISIPALFYLLSGTRPYQLGLTARRLANNVLLGVLTAICVVPVIYLVLLVVNAFLRRLGEAPGEHPLTKLVHEHPPTVDLVVGGLAALVAAPIIEELLFRGVVQPWCRTRRWGGSLVIAAAFLLALAMRWKGLRDGWQAHGLTGAWPNLLPAAFVLVMVPGYLLARARLPAAVRAVYATSLLFAAGHSFALSHPVPLFVFALALGLLRYRTQSLVPSVVTHSLFNAVAWVLLLLPSQPADKPEKGKETTDARPRPALVSTSSSVPGDSLPRRTYASAMTEPSPGE